MNVDILSKISEPYEDFGTAESDCFKDRLLDRLKEKLEADEVKELTGHIDLFQKVCERAGFCRGFQAATDITRAVDSYLE